MNKIILGLDLDGCLYDWHTAVYDYYCWNSGYTKSWTEFWTEFAWGDLIGYLVTLPFLYEVKIPPPNVINFLNYAKDNSEIYYITNRPENCKLVTERYIRKYFPSPNNLFITSDKATVCRYLGITHFLDDHIKNIKSVDGIADVYLMAKPWNREFQEDYQTVHSLKEFQDAIFQ
jgi:hypothetical protein